MNLRILSYLVICLFIGVSTVIIIEPSDAWWFDHFTSDTSASYTGKAVIPAYWDWEVPMSNITEIVNNAHSLYYNGESYNSGNFSYKFAWNTSTGVQRTKAIWGAADKYTDQEWTENCEAGITKYGFSEETGGGSIDSTKIFLYKCIAGVTTLLDSETPGEAYIEDPLTWHYIIVNWDHDGLESPHFPTGTTINVTYYKDGGTVYYMESSDTAITSGYSGFGRGYWNIANSWDWVNFSSVHTTTVCIPPSTGFSCIPTLGESPFDVQCTDASTGDTPFTYSWNVENQTGYGFKTSTVKNPVFNMSHLGVYNVNLSVTNACGDDWENKTGYLTVTPEKPTWPIPETCTWLNITPDFFYYTYRSVGSSTWNEIRNGEGTDCDIDGFYPTLGSENIIDLWDMIYRSVVIFDTSAIPDNSYVNYGEFSIYENDGWDTLGGGNWGLSSGYTENTSCDKADYKNFYEGASSSYAPIIDWPWAGYQTVTLNNNGKNQVNLAGNTIFYGRLKWDIENSPPAWKSDKIAYAYADELVEPIWLNLSYCPLTNCLADLTTEKGETWIKWNWTGYQNLTDYVIDAYNLYYNGALYRNNYPHNYFLKDDLGSNSYHVMEIQWFNDTYDWNVTCSYNAVRSDPAMVWWYLIVGLGLLTVGYFVPLFGFLAIIMFLLGFGMTYQEYNQSYIVLTYGLSAVIAMFITAIRLGERK